MRISGKMGALTEQNLWNLTVPWFWNVQEFEEILLVFERVS